MPEVRTQSPSPNALNTHLANRKTGFDPMNMQIPGYDNDPKATQPKDPQEKVEINQPKNDQTQTESLMKTLRRMLKR